MKPTLRSYHFNGRQQGLTLVELMIALALSFVLIAGALSSYLGSKQTYTFVGEMSLMQENARFLLQQLSRDIRLAGDTGCPSTALRNYNTAGVISTEYTSTIRKKGSTTISWISLFPRGVEGYTAAVSSASGMFLSGKSPKNNSDVLAVHRLNNDDAIAVSSHNTATATLTTSTAHGFSLGTPLMIIDGDCRSLASFTASAATSTTVKYETGGSHNYLNCAEGLTGGTVNCSSAPTNTSYDIAGDITLAKLATTAYFLRDDNTFMRLRAGSNSADALLKGVDYFEVQFGVDSDSDGVANRYYRPSAMASGDWVNVRTLHLYIALSSAGEVLGNNLSVSCGSSTVNSKKLRRCISATVNIRNRGGQNI